MSAPLLETRAVVRAFVDEAGGRLVGLGPVDLAVQEGELLAIVGPSGCGKSTLLNMLAGLDEASEGTIEFRGEPLPGPGPKLGVVFQKYTCLPWLSVQDNIALGLKWKGLSRADRRARARDLVTLVGLDGFAGAYPATLSGGMQQRVAIARALAGEPEVLLMDEPFGALDAQTRSRMQLEILRILAAAKRSTVFVTHDMDEAVFLADRVIVLTPRPGRIHTEVRVDLERPRTLDMRTSSRFAELRGQVARALEEATVEAVRAAAGG